MLKLPQNTPTPAELVALRLKAEQLLAEASAIRVEVGERLAEHLIANPADEPTDDDRLQRQRIAAGAIADPDLN